MGGGKVGTCDRYKLTRRDTSGSEDKGGLVHEADAGRPIRRILDEEVQEGSKTEGCELISPRGYASCNVKSPWEGGKGGYSKLMIR